MENINIEDMELSTILTPKQAWDNLVQHNETYYRQYAAEYSGDEAKLAVTARPKTFWNRPGKQKTHVPIAADIAATSADLLFSEEVKFSVFDNVKEVQEGEKVENAQKRLEEMLRLNRVPELLNEAAESCSALGDVYLKIGWDLHGPKKCPVIQIGQADAAWPDYSFGSLKAIHFFTNLQRIKEPSQEKATIYRAYECYTPGKIETKIFRGTEDSLGTDVSDAQLSKLGIDPETIVPDDSIAAVHIPNIRPNRLYRGSYMGRSDFDSLRCLMDALDETYSSWIRDIRLAKARLIVPVEYLRRKASDLFPDGEKTPPTFEFDEDVETLVALDADPDKVGENKITSSQFAIRADEHEKTCLNLITQIVTGAGYAPQTFGINIEGLAQSGTALHIREKKSFKTYAKKKTYWGDALEGFMTTLLHIDAEIFGANGSSKDVHVHVRFADAFANDITTLATAVELLHRAQAASVEVKVRMLHPDWSESEIKEEIKRVYTEYGIGIEPPDASEGDFADVGGNDGDDNQKPASTPQDGAGDAQEGTEDD